MRAPFGVPLQPPKRKTPSVLLIAVSLPKVIDLLLRGERAIQLVNIVEMVGPVATNSGSANRFGKGSSTDLAKEVQKRTTIQLVSGSKES